MLPSDAKCLAATLCIGDLGRVLGGDRVCADREEGLVPISSQNDIVLDRDGVIVEQPNLVSTWTICLSSCLVG